MTLTLRRLSNWSVLAPSLLLVGGLAVLLSSDLVAQPSQVGPRLGADGPPTSGSFLNTHSLIGSGTRVASASSNGIGSGSVGGLGGLMVEVESNGFHSFRSVASGVTYVSNGAGGGDLYLVQSYTVEGASGLLLDAMVKVRKIDASNGQVTWEENYEVNDANKK